jgi:hypothetical protein
MHFNFTTMSFPDLPDVAGARAMHHHNPRLSKSGLFNLMFIPAAFCLFFPTPRRWNHSGTEVAYGQHSRGKPFFGDLRHCAATTSSEQLTRRVLGCAIWFAYELWRQGS